MRNSKPDHPISISTSGRQPATRAETEVDVSRREVHIWDELRGPRWPPAYWQCSSLAVHTAVCWLSPCSTGLTAIWLFFCTKNTHTGMTTAAAFHTFTLVKLVTKALYIYVRLKVYSAFHPCGVSKWVSDTAGKVKAGMVHSDCEWTCGYAGKTVKYLENTCHTWALLRWWYEEALYQVYAPLPIPLP